MENPVNKFNVANQNTMANNRKKLAAISPPVLELKNVTKTFGNRIAVNNVSFRINEGEIFGFLGPNGAGKSTTMKMICGLSQITRGDIFVCGKSVKDDFTETARLIGGLIETPIMYNYMSGYDNLKYYASLYGGIKKSDTLFGEYAYFLKLIQNNYIKSEANIIDGETDFEKLVKISRLNLDRGSFYLKARRA